MATSNLLLSRSYSSRRFTFAGYLSAQYMEKRLLKLCSEEDLVSFHKSLLKLKEDYTPPFHLMNTVNSEYRAYIESGDYYTWLALATRLLKPKRILELGNYHGASTIMIYSELTDKTEAFYSVDLKRDLSFIPTDIFLDSRVKFTFGNDLNLSIYNELLPVNLDFLFIDTLHEYYQVSYEWKIYKNLCKSNSIVVLDDILLNDMPKFWAELPYPKIDISSDCHNSGFGVFIYQPEDKQILNEVEMNKRAYIAALEIAYQHVRLNKASLLEISMKHAKTFLNRHKKVEDY
jgi:hypothetical protein